MQRRRHVLGLRVVQEGLAHSQRGVHVALAPLGRRQYSRIIVEEFDNSLHPSRAKLLVQTLSEAANRRKLNVLVTTHNPAFMDALDESQMDSVLICHGDESGWGSRVTKLGDMDIASTVGLRGGLGDFMTRGALEEHLAPDLAERHSKETQEWVASLS